MIINAPPTRLSQGSDAAMAEPSAVATRPMVMNTAENPRTKRTEWRMADRLTSGTLRSVSSPNVSPDTKAR